MLKHLALLVIALLAVGHCSSTEDNVKRVLANYDKTKPPNENHTIIMRVGIHVLSLDFSDVTSEMKMSMYFRQSWTDTRLFGFGFASVRLLDFDKIWLPDTFIRNDRNDELAPGKLSDNFRLLKVTRGTVWYVVKITASLSCLTRTRRYPKDAPVCEMNIESFGYTEDVMMLAQLPNPVEVADDQLWSNGMYLIDTKLSDCSVNFSTVVYPCLNIKLHFRRAASLQFFTVVYLPSAVIVLVSTSSFWIQPDNPTARLLVGLSTTLTVTLHAAAVRLRYVSTVTEPTLLDLWLIGCVIIVFLAFVLQLAGIVVAKKRSKATLVEATAIAENTGRITPTCIIDLVGKVAIPVLFVLLIIVYVAV